MDYSAILMGHDPKDIRDYAPSRGGHNDSNKTKEKSRKKKGRRAEEQIKDTFLRSGQSVEDNVVNPIRKASLDLASNVAKGSSDIAELLGYDKAKYYLDKYDRRFEGTSNRIPEGEGPVAYAAKLVPENAMLLANHPAIKGPALMASALGAYGDVVSSQKENGDPDRLAAAEAAAINTAANLLEIGALKGASRNIKNAGKVRGRKDFYWDPSRSVASRSTQLMPNPVTQELQLLSKKNLDWLRRKEYAKAGSKFTGNIGTAVSLEEANDAQKEYFGSRNK